MLLAFFEGSAFVFLANRIHAIFLHRPSPVQKRPMNRMQRSASSFRWNFKSREFRRSCGRVACITRVMRRKSSRGKIFLAANH